MDRGSQDAQSVTGREAQTSPQTNRYPSSLAARTLGVLEPKEAPGGALCSFHRREKPENRSPIRCPDILELRGSGVVGFAADNLLSPILGCFTD